MSLNLTRRSQAPAGSCFTQFTSSEHFFYTNYDNVVKSLKQIAHFDQGLNKKR